ncbi:Thiamine phosphate phosphatase-like protein [Thalictrum thalictroides]|uniref:Thiamine phosphate phosphatase-like protein n=1 Tax=Thalictrum thalictroides TaxID=46969 RepID=A0A7J6WWV2_THATH|nr:Thiamine phosphate phosphatase-like protein [Thalictrum thalictroides]
MANTMVVFDFDKTIIDCDSDNWVVEQMGFKDLFFELMPTMPWNLLMDRMMKEIQSQGKTIEDIANCLKTAYLHPNIISAIKSAFALGCELRVVSDANHFFIETILKHHGLIDCFSEINTNPNFIDDEGRLRILPFHDFISSPHGCERCPPNMCKGMVIERIRASDSANRKRFIYIGDGRGDFCASIKLNEEDYVMPRKKYPLWELIQNDRQLIKAEIHEWSDGEELERILLHLINKTNNPIGSTSSPMSSADNKFQTTTQETYLPTLKVYN